MTTFGRKGIDTYKRLLSATLKYWPIFLLGILATLVLSLIDAGFAWLVKPIIDKGFISRNTHFIRWLPPTVLIVFVFRGVVGFSSNYFIYHVARYVVMDFRRAIFCHLLKLPARFYDRHNSGHLLSTIIYNVEQVAEASSDALVTVLRQGSLVIGLIGVMFVVSWQLALLFLIISPIIAWVVKKVSVRLRRLSSNVQKSMGEVTHVANEGIDAYKVIRLYGGQDYENQKFHQATKSNRQRELKVIVTNSIGTSLVQLLIAVPIAVVLFFATQPSLGVSAGSFAAVASAMIMLLSPMRRLTLMNSYIQKGIAGAESIFDLLDEDVEKDKGTVPLTRVKGKIEYRQVSFNYEQSQRTILSDVSFTVEPGKTIAIVGRSGSGKTTLINLLPRFYEISTGDITIDGINIQDCRLQDLRNQFALVSQHTALFNDTIARNIAYAQADADPKAVLAAAEAAHAMEFINQMPDGMNTVVGEDGVLLSGGQRQRIAIARALFKNAPILILDEATSSLDTHAERHIQSALENLMQQRTTLVIAHRLSTIENADSIIVMEKGKIVESGTHATLLVRGGAYAELHRMQFSEQLVENKVTQ